MSATVVLLGGTGRTGRQVLLQLLERRVCVRAIVRSADRLPVDVLQAEALTIMEADLLSLSDECLRSLVRGCDAVVSCLGHNTTFQGMFGAPRDLVTQSAARVCRTIEALQPDSPVKFILMSSVSVNQPEGRDTRRGLFEKAAIALLRALVPPGKDNQAAADFFCHGLDSASPFVEWVAVRPDSLQDGPVTPYALHAGLVNSIFAPGNTNRANVAHFMCELAEDARLWDEWKSRLPVIVNAAAE
jgi:nucleoside-diphosphate-sugar epimerase